MARKHRGRLLLSDSEVAERAGLSRRAVIRISNLKQWDGMTFDVGERFALACGVDFDNLQRHIEYLKRRKKVAWQQRGRVVMARLKRQRNES